MKEKNRDIEHKREMIVTNSQVASHKECPSHEAYQKQKGRKLVEFESTLSFF